WSATALPGRFRAWGVWGPFRGPQSRDGFAQGPQRAAAAPRIQPDTGAPGERRRERDLGNRNEAEADPDPIEPLRAREHRAGVERGRVIEAHRHELRRNLERVIGAVVRAHDGAVQQDVATVLLAGHGANEALAARARRGRP